MAIIKPPFRTDYPPGPVRPTGALLSKIGESLNSQKPAVSASNKTHSGLGNQSIGDPPMLIGVATIVDDQNTCPVSSSGEVDAPCKRQDKYKAKFRYYDASTRKWIDLYMDLRLDAGPYHNGIPGVGSIPTYVTGETVAAVYDPNAGWCVPLQGPPDYQGTYDYSGQSNIGVPRADRNIAIANNAVEISLEQFAGGASYAAPGSWAPLSPRLILNTGDSLGGRGSGSIMVTTTLRHYERLRLRCGTGWQSRAELAVKRHGLSIRFIGKSGSFAGGIPSIYGPTNGFSTLPDLALIGASRTRFAEAPSVASLGTELRIEMVNQSDEWLAEIVYWAEVEQRNLSTFVIIDQQAEDEQTAKKKRHELIEPNDEGFHDAIVIDNINVNAQRVDKAGDAGDTRDMRCWLAFVNYYDDPEEGKVIGEQGRIYGPCKYVGTFDMDGDNRPVYICCEPFEEYIAKRTTQNGTTAKGEVEDFDLYDGFGRKSDIQRAAYLKFNKLNNKCFAIASRFQSRWIANQIECNPDAGNQ